MNDAAVAEAGVDAAVGVVAGHAAGSAPGHDDLAVAAHRHGNRPAKRRRSYRRGWDHGDKGRNHLAAGAEGRVQAAVGVVARQTGDREAGGIDLAGRNDLAVGLNR